MTDSPCKIEVFPKRALKEEATGFQMLPADLKLVLKILTNATLKMT